MFVCMKKHLSKIYGNVKHRTAKIASEKKCSKKEHNFFFTTKIRRNKIKSIERN